MDTTKTVSTPEEANKFLNELYVRRRSLVAEIRNPSLKDEKGRTLAAKDALEKKYQMQREIGEITTRITQIKQYLGVSSHNPNAQRERERKEFICKHAASLSIHQDIVLKDCIGEAIELADELEEKGVAFWDA